MGLLLFQPTFIDMQYVMIIFELKFDLQHPQIHQTTCKQIQKIKDMNKQQSTNNFDVAVIGAGVYGLCVAYYLSKVPDLRVCLLQQFSIGHSNGSSHSPTRITRSTYETAIYRDLNLLCLQKNWKEMTELLQEKIVYDAPYILFDENQQTYEFYKNVASNSENFKFMTPEEVSKVYSPMPTIHSKMTPIVDTKAGIIAADTFIIKLRDYLLQKCKNVVVKQNINVKKLTENQNQVIIETSEGFINAKKVVVSSGKWLSEMAPEIKDLVKVVKQFMGYVELKDRQKYQVGKFCSFSHRTESTHFWSLPDRRGIGVKLGNHNLDRLKPQEDTIQFQQKFVQAKAKQIFGEEFVKVNKVQVCYYTVTKTQDFILDWTGNFKRIFICSCCSGHGFKFAPLIGEIISDLITSGQSIELYEKQKHLFSLEYHRSLAWKTETKSVQ